MKSGRSQRQQQTPLLPPLPLPLPPLLLLLLLPLLLLLLVTGCAGLPQGSSSDGDLAAANAALSARLLQTAGGGSVGSHKRHVTRPHAPLLPQPPPAGDPAAALKVIRRRKVLSPRAPRRGDVSGDDVTERTFQESLRPPFLALLNETHFSLQPEFVLAQASEQKLEPFRGFGEKLDMPAVAGRPRDFRAVPRSDNGAAERANVTAEEGLAGELSERHGKVIVRRKKVRVLSPKDASALNSDASGEESVSVDKRSGEVKKLSETSSTSKVSPTEEKNAQNPEVKTHEPETTTEKSVAVPSSTPTVKLDDIGIVPRRIASKRRPGRLLVPLPKTTHPPTTEKPKPARKSDLRNQSSASSLRGTPNSTTDAAPRRPGVRVASLKPRRRPPGVDRTTTPRTPKTTASPRTTTTTKSPARRLLSAAAQRRRERFRNRASRIRPNATTAGVSTTEAAPVNREKKEVEKVLGLLGRIRNRSRSRPSFLPERGGDGEEASSVAATTAAPSTSSATTARPSTTSTTTTTTTKTTTEEATKSPTEKTTTTPTTTTTTTTTARTTTTAKTTTSGTTATTTEHTTTKPTTSPPVTVRVSSTTAPTATETTSQSTVERETSSSPSTNGNAASQLLTTTAPIVATSQATTSSPPTTTSSPPKKRRQRPDTLRRTPLASNADRPNLLARRLEERRHTFSLRSGPKAGRRPPILPPTIPPFPLLLSTIKSAQQRGLLGRNVTISVTFPRGTPGFSRGRPALPVPRPSRLPPRQSPVKTNSTQVPSVSPPVVQSYVQNNVPEVEESASDVPQNSDKLSVSNSNNESKAQGADNSDVQRTVLGTSLETSVSIAVSPLEFRLRKRVKLPSSGSGKSKQSGDGPSDVLESQVNPNAARLGVRDGAGVVSSEEDEKELEGGKLPTKDNKALVDIPGGRIVPAPESTQGPVLESSVTETTEPGLGLSEETSPSPSEREISDRDEPPSSSTKDEDLEEEEDDDVSPKLGLSETIDNPEDTGIALRFGLSRHPEKKPSSSFSNINSPDTNSKLSSTTEHRYHSTKDHSYVQDFPTRSGNDKSAETNADNPASAEPDTRKPFLRRPSEEGFVYFSDVDFDGDDKYPEYDTDDLAAEASTTMATFVRPTESEMERILSTDGSASASTPTSASSPAVHYSHHSEHHPPAASASLGDSSPASSSPPSVAYTTPSSPSSTTQPSSTTPREARVLEVSGNVQAVSPEPEEPAAAGGPIYLVSLLFVVPVVAVLIWYLKKNHPDVQQLLPERLKSMLAHETSSDAAQENFYPVEVEETAGKPSTSHSHDTLARRRRWEHPRDTLRLQSVLGEGHFGQVWRAEVDNIGGLQGTLLVAVKNAKESATAKEHQDLLRELRIMQDLGSHPNVVTLLGCCTTEEPVLVIMEYMVFGKLLTYLRENRGRHNYYNFSHDSAVLTSPDLTLFACQVAAGMEYIADKGIIHRDLAARNILVDHTKVCKVSDFGMSRSAKEISTEVFEQKHRGALPIRWMSPESLYHNTFNQQTDCWSFGILLWEIITLGSTPYPGLSAREVMRSVREGYRLERPDHCHPQLYQLASSCWTAEPSWRPTFAELRNELETLLEDQNQGYVDLDRFQEEIYSTLHKSSDEKV